MSLCSGSSFRNRKQSNAISSTSLELEMGELEVKTITDVGVVVARGGNPYETDGDVRQIF